MRYVPGSVSSMSEELGLWVMAVPSSTSLVVKVAGSPVDDRVWLPVLTA